MSAATEAPVRFDPMSAEFRNNMIAAYERLLREDPVHQMADGRWVLTRHRDVTLALTDHKKFRRPHEWTSKRHGDGPLAQWASENMIAMNPPDHTRFRKAIARLFMPKEVEKMRSIVESTTAELIANIPYDEPFDFIDKFAYPLPVAIICNMMDIPSSDHHLFGHATGAVIAAGEIFASPEVKAHGEENVVFLRDYLGEIARKRETDMGTDIISVLVKHQQEDQLSRTEVIHAAISLLMAGHETTTHLLGNGLIALIRNPDQLQRLRNDPEGLLPTAIDEFLRYDPSLYTGYRMTNEEVRIDDKVIPKDAFVFVGFASANRDPEVFENPSKLDVGRTNATRHVSFGGGAHLCLGYMLARMEGRVAFRSILSNFGSLELAGEPTPRDGVVFKGCMKIPARFGRPEMKAAAE